jgi:formate C-acetyltransferase
MGRLSVAEKKVAPLQGAETIDCSMLERAGEYMAGYFSEPGGSPLRRMCLGLKRYFETCPLPEYNGEPIYPCGETIFAADQAMCFQYSSSMTVNHGLLEQKIAAAEPDVAEALGRFGDVLADYPMIRGYTHSIVNFGRVLREGLNGYRTRIEQHLRAARERGDADRVDFHESLLILLDGVSALHRRMCDLLHASDAPGVAEVATAFDRVPFGPAESFHEAMVATNFIYYLDGCDDLGRFDQELGPYYDADLSLGVVTHDEAVAWVTRLFENVDICNGWNCAIGGRRPDGSDGSNALTLVCLEAAKGRRRPNLALRLAKHTPEEVWDQALETISGGTGIPALYNEEEYIRAIHENNLGVEEEDLAWIGYGGCTELMIHGKSNVGSLDADYHLAVCLDKTLHRHLAACSSFEQFMGRFKRAVAEEIAELTEEISGWQERKGRYQPQPIRTLLIEDCIDNGREFNAGGARYNWSIISISGLANVYDSLAAVKKFVFETGQVSAQELLDALNADFEGYEDLRRLLQSAPSFGNDDPYVDEIAADVAEFTFGQFTRYTTWRGGKYLASCLLFVTYGRQGEPVGALPDGRKNATPIGDSAGAFQGRDTSGPTALLKSVASIPHFMAPGTLVVNIRFTKSLFADGEARERIKALVRTYFEMGGMQIQINVVDQAILRDAIENPEKHADLIVRVGGYSEYFNRLEERVKRTVLERTEHA